MSFSGNQRTRNSPISFQISKWEVAGTGEDITGRLVIFFGKKAAELFI
jgi:hypothetical protein